MSGALCQEIPGIELRVWYWSWRLVELRHWGKEVMYVTIERICSVDILCT